MLLPPELIQPLEYNTTLHLQWGHFLTVRGRDPPSTFAAESDARFKALRSTQCLVMHAQGLNFSNVSPLLSFTGGLHAIHPPKTSENIKWHKICAHLLLLSPRTSSVLLVSSLYGAARLGKPLLLGVHASDCSLLQVLWRRFCRGPSCGVCFCNRTACQAGACSPEREALCTIPAQQQMHLLGSFLRHTEPYSRMVLQDDSRSRDAQQNSCPA